MKQLFLLLISIFIYSSSYSQNFSKSISIESAFSVSELHADPNYKNLQKYAGKITDVVSNIFTSYQQDFDYKFYGNYQTTIKQQSTFTCSGKVLDRTLMNAKSQLFNYKKGSYFLRIEMHDPTRNETVFGKSFIIDQYIEHGSDATLLQQLQSELRFPLSLYFFNTSRQMPPSNHRNDTITFAIDETFSSNESIDKKYLKQLTDITSNAVLIHQAFQKANHGNEEKYSFNFYRNYLKSVSSQKNTHNEFKGHLDYDTNSEKYSLNIDLYVEGRKVVIPESINPPIEFTNKDKDSYMEVGLHIKQKIGLMLYYYFERYALEK